MSILIKSMDMPKENNKKLLLLISADGTVDITSFLSSYVQKTDATAVEVPTPHGDLIDKNEIIKRYENDCGRRIYVDNFIHDIELNMPTIIEADMESEDKE